MTDTYRSIAFTEYGDSGVLQVLDRELPEPGPGQVRIAVRAAGVNPIDWKIRAGLMAEVFPTEFPAVPGGDVAGVVDAIGEGVSGFAAGDEVLGSGIGGYAEFVLADPAKLTRKPESLSWELAAALPVVVNTAYRALNLLDLEKGETLLVDGAAGGVGTIAVQLAVARGLTVVGTASEANHDYLRSLGAVPVQYGEGLAERVRAVAPQGIDASFDASGQSLATLVELTGGPKRVVTIAAADAADHGVRFTSGSPAEQVPGSLAEGAALAAEGKLTLPISRVYPLAEAAAAQDESQAGHVRGKLVLVP
ncbi:NADP-dependent oxidoreductase [Amycolatopsis azurea]|uniref:NADPH:quinone reductase n=1 Tax=Amycolatopsis azurea DSM 43854 TaxID=1238180 RepID=M2Q6Y1_9PSEU|nr:NADP-dependent oxidoreductase [Amycolatopsis azurea]EMD27740.1 zinc-containing alcohol dehydrogenase [Amycolatopsis azurea DSM 43854]OOC03129.1 NADPH:quinone reductase [Amycolatopsis azurea DSM 43854]